MNKHAFWKGFIVGGILFVASILFIYVKFILPPDISLKQVELSDLNGNRVDLNEYLGKPLVVNYWATWCAPCLKEFPHFEKVKQSLGNQVNFIMISDESLDKLVAFSTSKPFTFNYLRNDSNLKQYGINGRPISFFYNAQGELVTKHSGVLNSNILWKKIESIK